MDKENEKFPEVLELNVGGVHYTTSLITLVKGGNDMLSCLFSGQHHIAKDKDGRYFIDADGPLFAYILRYLRSGNLPDDKMAHRVYQEAKYFGLEELQQNIEQMPVMMAAQARLQFQDRLEGFEDAVEEILKVASSQQGILSDEVISYAIIAILKDTQTFDDPLFDPEHKCWKLTTTGNMNTNVLVGPWKNVKDLEVTDRVYLRALQRELESKGFTVTMSKVGGCSYEVLNENETTLKCGRTLHKIIFHWHKLYQ